jgi:hypothetical protein
LLYVGTHTASCETFFARKSFWQAYDDADAVIDSDKTGYFRDILWRSTVTRSQIATQRHQRRRQNAVGVADRHPDTHLANVYSEPDTSDEISHLLVGAVRDELLDRRQQARRLSSRQAATLRQFSVAAATPGQ